MVGRIGQCDADQHAARDALRREPMRGPIHQAIEHRVVDAPRAVQDGSLAGPVAGMQAQHAVERHWQGLANVAPDKVLPTCIRLGC